MIRRLREIFGDDELVDESVSISGIDPNDVFLMTDPNAIEKYRNEERLDELEHDLRFDVMRGRPWQHEDLEYVAEIRRLLVNRTIEPKGSWWWTSPHPTVYRARKSGILRIGEKVYKFKKGKEITFQCQMEREKKDLDGPLLLGNFTPTDRSSLCGGMDTAMKGM